MNVAGREFVVVLGMHRSGTSAVAGLLSHLGAQFGDRLIPPGPDNTKGFFEDSELVALNDEILAELGLSWKSCVRADWDDATILRLLDKYGEQSHSLIKRLISTGSNIAGMKDPRVARLLPFWTKIFSQTEIRVNVIWVLRNPTAVYKSLQHRNGYSENVSLALWSRYNLDILEFTPKTRLKIVDFDDALSDELSIASQFSTAYKLPFSKDEYRSFFDPSMRHSTDTRDEATSGAQVLDTIRTLSNDLYACLKSNQGHPLDTRDLEIYLASSAAHLDQISDLIDEVAAKETSLSHERNIQIELQLKAQQDARDREQEHQTKVNILSEEIEKLREEISNLYTENYRLNAQIADIFSSRSWKITRLYRAIGRRCQKLVKTPIYIKVYFQFLYSKIFHRISGLAQAHSSNQAAVHELAQGRGNVLHETLKTYNTELGDLPDIDITVVTHNSSRWIEGFFSSLCSQRYPLSRISLFIVDNSSADNTLTLIQEQAATVSSHFRSLTVDTLPNNGFGYGQNHAIRSGIGGLILVTNIDLEFTENAILEVVTHAMRDTEDIASWELRQQPFEHPKYYDPVTLKTSWSSHACVLLRRIAYANVGGYEKKIFMYGEDVELSYRLRRHGYHLKYVPSAVVNHYAYEDEHSFKPIQFYGSTLANAYIRLRYGNVSDIFGIVTLYLMLLSSGGPPGVSRRAILGNIWKILLNGPYFLLSRKKPETGAHFPFRKWDYEMIREGSFYSSPTTQAPYPKVSIITRTYPGRERWLYEAITSVLNQTYDSIELIIVEDGGSTQETLIERCTALFTGNRAIRYSAQPKLGRSYNGNAGLEAATGDYIMFLDDDDLLFPDHVEVLAKELLANEGIAATYALSWEAATTYLQHEENLYIEQMHSTPNLLRQEFDREVLKVHNYLPIQSVLFRRTLFEHYGGFDVEMYQLEDWDLWFRYSSESDFKYVPKVTSIYRTPYNASERASRHQLLHENYEFAKGKQADFLRSLPIMSSKVNDVPA